MQFDEFMDVLNLIKNPAKYEALVNELLTRNKAIQDSITQLGVVGDVAKARRQVESNLAMSQASIASAQKQASEIIAGAEVAYTARHEELKAREVVSDQALANYNTIKSQITARENELRMAEKQLTAAQVQLGKDRDELATKQAEVEMRLEKLRQVMG